MPPLFRRILTALLAVTTAAASPADETFTRELDAWRAQRLARLTAPDGWLTLVGLHWLQPGENTIGSAADNSVRFAAGPAFFGTVHLAADGRVTFLAAPGAMARTDGRPVAGAREGTVELLHRDGAPTVVTAHSVSFHVLARGDQVGLRVRDSESPRRLGFAGLVHFPADPSWRIEAEWVRFDTPREIPITNILGHTAPEKVPGKAVFTREGRTFELLPVAASDAENLFFIISDATSGEETYAAARFLYAAPPRDGKVVLDFNRAYNPPCAFTPFATCPLPPKENRLPIRITAGEKTYAGAH